MPGSRFWRTQRLRLVQELSQRISDNAPPDRRTGTKVGAGQVNVDNQTYELRDGADVAVGASVELENIGRRSAAIYRPVRGTVSVSGGGGGTGATGTLGDHTHTDTDGDGGTFPITNHSDVSATGPSNNDVLVYNSSTGEWENSTDVAVLSRPNTFMAKQTVQTGDFDVLTLENTAGNTNVYLIRGEGSVGAHATLNAYTSTSLSANTFLGLLKFEQSQVDPSALKSRVIFQHNIGDSANEAMRIEDTGHILVDTTDDGGQVSIAQPVAFTKSTTTVADNIQLQGAGATGNGNYGASIGFSVVTGGSNRRVAIAAVQTAADGDRVGLAFLTHASAIGTDDMIEAGRFNDQGYLGLGTTAPQGKFHGYDSISGFLHWEFDGLAGTTETVIPNGVGDVLYGLAYRTVVRSSGGTVQARSSGATPITPGNSATLYIDGSDQVNLAVAADGSVTVERTGGTLTYKIALWLLFL